MKYVDHQVVTGLGGDFVIEDKCQDFGIWHSVSVCLRVVFILERKSINILALGL